MAAALVGGWYEEAERSLLQQALADDDVVMELGSGIGFLATVCARRLGVGRVFTFEANPELIPVAHETFELNGASVVLQNCILGRQEGIMKFYVETNLCRSSTLPRSTNSRLVQVPVKPFQQMLREIEPSFLIVDIEGGEAELFDGIDLSRVRKVLIELHPSIIGPSAVEHVLELLFKAGFVVRRRLAAGANFQLFLAR